MDGYVIVQRGCGALSDKLAHPQGQSCHCVHIPSSLHQQSLLFRRASYPPFNDPPIETKGSDRKKGDEDNNGGVDDIYLSFVHSISYYSI